jgi:general secretion pathway protein C
MNFLERHMAKFILALMVTSGVALVFFAYNLQKTLRAGIVLPPAVSGDEGKGKLEIPTLKPKSNYDLVAKRNIFVFAETADGKPKSAAQTDQKPVETPLNVRLKGTVVSPEGFAVAMIEDPAQRKEELYVVGDKIQDAEILKIHDSQVILRRGGREETLSLFSDQTARGARGPSGAAPAGARPASASSPTTPSPTPPGSPAAVQQRGVQQQIQNLMAQLRLRPHFQEGKPAGFVVGQIQKGSVFDTAGLKEGDVIVGINDEEIKTPNQLLKAYKEVSEERALWLGVVRGGQEETIEVDIASVLSKE